MSAEPADDEGGTSDDAPLNAAEEDPTTRPGETPDSAGVGTAEGPPVSALLTDEDDLPDADDDEVEVGLGP